MDDYLKIARKNPNVIFVNLLFDCLLIILQKKGFHMKIAKIFSGIGIFIMAGIISYGFIKGDFSHEGSVILSIAWGKVSLVDVYVGFLVFSGWIMFREKSPIVIIAWVIGLLILGNLTSCIYVFLALHKSRGDWKKFWFGNKIINV